ncbi:MAG: type II toxin-antitoxin system RelE/ParE family toxin [Chitinophagaceae bacterium]|nr:type II toxin-antitoxin system RelE/ParE family toxin [Chitinophagaceae bacterium]
MKKYKLFFTGEAVDEIKHIAAWYELQKRGLGKRFKTLLKEELGKIKQNPFTRSVRYDNVRFAVPAVFPYAAHYTIDEPTRTVTIHAVLGFSQDPEENWLKQ